MPTDTDPLTLGRMVCANGETIEWTLRYRDEVLARCWAEDEPRVALRRLLLAVQRGEKVP